MVTFAGNEFLSFYTDYVGGTNRFIVIGVQQWGFLSGSGSSDFTWTYPQSFTSSVYSIQLAMRSGGSTTASYNAFKTTSYSLTKWQGYMSLKEDVSFFLLAIGRQMQWGCCAKNSSNNIDNIRLSIAVSTIYAIVVSYTGQNDLFNGAVLTYGVSGSAFSVRRWSTCAYYWMAIGQQQWGTISHSEWVVTTFTYPITMRKVYAAVLAREDAANNKTEYTVTLISKNRTSLQFNGWRGDANVIVIGS